MSRPWTQRVIAAAPLAPAWVGAAIALANVALCLAYFSLVGWPDAGGIASASFWQTLGGAACTMSALVGFAIAGTTYSERASRSAIRDLQPMLRGSEADHAQLEDEVTRFDAKRLRWVGLLIVVGGVPLILADVATAGVPIDVPLGPSVLIWVIWLNALLCWHLSRSLSHEFAVSRRFSQLGAEHVEIDLLNLRGLAPFARRGLQSSLFWIVCVSIFTLQAAAGWGADFLPYALAAMAAVAAVVLVLPALGVHRSIVAAKDRELARLAAEIQPAGDQVLATDAGANPETVARLTALLALRQQLEATREWPFDVPTLLRFALYLGIGLGSWLGAALVERALDVAMP